ncbi:hypothetical protein FXO38_17822 [Capsicum annuum]|nr:hypothetical protein FXO37_19130 [Capsicum annuum]KAF3649144.1 hypothetical protein FXO38_17822 [Capsicum annuum]
MVLQNNSDGCESRFIQEILKVVVGNLSRAVLSVGLHPVGIDSLVDIMAIYGMGGIGKSTLVKTSYNLNFDKFDGNNFLVVVNKTSERHSGLIVENFCKVQSFFWPNSVVKITKKARRIVKMLCGDFVGIPDECKTNFDLKRLESQLLEVIDGNTSLSYNSELNGCDLSEYMDCLGENLNDVLECHRESNRSYLERNQFLKQLEIVQKKMNFFRYLYATKINGYVNHEKLECLETGLQFMANNVGQFCLAILVDAAESEDDIFNKPPYLLCLIMLVELEMNEIFLGEL